jgi:hypothetical protein
MGSEWGLGPLRIGWTTADISAIHWFAASRLRRRRQSRHSSRLGLTTGDARQHRRDRPRREPDGRTDGPEPGHLMARSARRRRKAGRMLRRRAIRTGDPVSAVDDRE